MDVTVADDHHGDVEDAGRAEDLNRQSHWPDVPGPATDDQGQSLASTALAESVVGVYHVRIPVSDVLRSRDWYANVLGFDPVLDYEEEDRLVGVVLTHPSGVTLGLHLEPDRIPALRGFAILSLCVNTKADLNRWSAHFDRVGIDHSSLTAGPRGTRLEITDPDGICTELHTRGHPTSDDA